MSIMTSSSSDSISLEWLALSPAPDRANDRYADRLRESVPRVTRRLGALAGRDTDRMLAGWREVFLALPSRSARMAVSHPLFNYYWLQLMQACVSGDRAFVRDWAHHLGRFLVIPACEHGLPCPAPIMPGPAEPELRLPGYPAHLAFGGQPQPLAVWIGDDGDGVIRKGTVRVPRSFLDASAACPAVLGSVTRVMHPLIEGTDIEMDAGDPWISRLMTSMNAKPAQPGYPAPDLEPLLNVSAAQQADIGRAFGLIERVWPELAAEIKANVSMFVPYRSAFHSSFTEACMMGAVFLSEAMWPFSAIPYTAEHFLHEEAHLRLTLIEELDPLLTPFRQADYASPWRRDPRPLSGLLQAAFAFARIAVFHRKAYEETGDPVHDRRHAEVVDLLVRGMSEVERGPVIRFTQAGEELWAQMRAEAERR